MLDRFSVPESFRIGHGSFVIGVYPEGHPQFATQKDTFSLVYRRESIESLARTSTPFPPIFENVGAVEARIRLEDLARAEKLNPKEQLGFDFASELIATGASSIFYSYGLAISKAMYMHFNLRTHFLNGLLPI